MTDNQKLQLWQAGILGNPDELQVPYNTPDYLNDDAAAMSLLDTLVGRDKWFILQNDSGGGFALEIGGLLDFGGSIFVVRQSTINEAITAACLEVIGREDV